VKSYQIFPLLILAFCLGSCSDDDDDAAENIDSISSYVTKIQFSYQSNDGYMRGNIVDNKFFSETYFFNGSNGNGDTSQRYFYDNGRLASYGGGFDSEMFFYDAAGKLTAIDWTDDTMTSKYQRFSYHAGNVVYDDIMSGPHTDTEATLLDRAIVEFDAHGNIAKAGYDRDFNGVMDQVNVFSFADDNLISFQLHGGSQRSYEYSNVRNNFAVLNDNSFGKQVARLRNSFFYASENFSSLPLDSQNLTTTEVAEGSYELLRNGLYRKSVVTSAVMEGQMTIVTEFFFH